MANQTVGQVKRFLKKLPHGAGVDPELLTGYLNDRVEAMMNFHPWTRLNKSFTIQTPLLTPGSNDQSAIYQAGTVALASGGTALTLTGGAWTAAMEGFRFRITGELQFYTFHFLTPTTGTIDRPYEGTGNLTASAYTILQAIYEMPADLDFLQSIELPRLSLDLDQTTQELLDQEDASRALSESTGGPYKWAPWQDSGAGNSQIELYPNPFIAEGLPARYRSRAIRYAIQDTSSVFPTWVETGVLRAGIEADLYGLQGNQAMKVAKEADWVSGLTRMAVQDDQRIIPTTMRMAQRYVEHRIDRANGGDPLRQERYIQM